jgi:uncharacterized metal-binding protein YceD (DUF177 family)
MTTRPLSASTIGVGAMPATGHEARIEATAAERETIAGDYGLVEVRALGGDVSVNREAGDSIVVEGRVTAEIVQNCVVSFEPVVQSIDEAFVVRYVGAGAPGAPAAPKPGAEVHLDPNAEPPDLLTGDDLDLGAVVLEHFALAIDPYPRAPGAAVPVETGEATGPTGDSPFAVLAKLTGRH